MKGLRSAIGWIAVILSFAFLARLALTHAHEVRELRWTRGTSVGLGTAALFQVATLVSGGWAWGLLLRGLGSDLPRRSAILVVLRANVAKYLPGNVAHYAGRALLARQAGVPAPTVLTSLGLEAGLTVGSGLLLAAVIAPRALGAWLAAASASAILLASALLTAAAIAGGVALARAYRTYRATAAEDRERPAAVARRLGTALGLYVLNFLLLGAGLTALATGGIGAPSDSWFFLTGALAVAWIAGFVVPGSPGGVGVREAVLVAELSPEMGAAGALGVALLLRLATVAGDVVAFIAGNVRGRRRASAIPEEPP